MTTEPGDRPLTLREVRKQDRRAAILAAARRSFLEEGYAATSMSGLLRTLGGSKATLWSYFPSKEELFGAVIAEVTAAFRQQVMAELDAPGGLEATLVKFCRSFMNKTSHADALAVWRLVMAESGRFPEVGRIFYQQAAGHIERALVGYIQQQIDARRLRDDGALNMARVLIGMTAAQQNRRLWGVEPPGSEGMDADARRFVGYFLRLFATGPSQA
ncbi:TetR/AcrR family transcriptional regulator [Sphingomonas sp. 2R-10]|uniref:TetR/AcrR family transcriptional regulator n=1 Tax=Sphingomonas sp. 2R-10 TaxID=3045148 RepID=UPI0013DE6AB2|nr:TetR/AcrR family transcriptional regulator [Sphingomonas sp. 2R-10]MDJ0278273.1 TetR/AcrR family transcriptional regulator [Sphingomonas sp. 2R-10]